MVCNSVQLAVKASLLLFSANCTRSFFNEVSLAKLPLLSFQENVLAESKAMVPDSKQRLDAAVADLKKLIVRFKYFMGSASPS